MSETVKRTMDCAVGGVSIINMVVVLLCTFLCVMSMVNYCMQVAVPSRGLGYYYVPHLLVGLVFGISLIIMAIGGFKRNHVLCLIATIFYGVDFVVARVFDYFSGNWIIACGNRFGNKMYEGKRWSCKNY